jgi:hypothetical protein
VWTGFLPGRNPPTRAFSGEAAYRKTVKVTQPRLLAARRLVLSFGEATTSPPDQSGKAPLAQAHLEAPVREAAIVSINGQRAGSVWQPPYEVDLGKLVHEGENKIEIRVLNLGVNQCAGRPLAGPDGRAASDGDPFAEQTTDAFLPMPAGLFGPVTISAAD